MLHIHDEHDPPGGMAFTGAILDCPYSRFIPAAHRGVN